MFLELFNKNKKSFSNKSKEFEKQLALTNRLIDNLDFNISEFRRKLMNLQMRGKSAQSVSELEWMLRDMHRQAEEAQKAVNSLEKKHIDCVSLVDKLVDEFEEALKDAPD